MAERIVYKRADGKYAWRLIGDNESDIIATDGGQGYSTKAYAVLMAENVITGEYSKAKRTDAT